MTNSQKVLQRTGSDRRNGSDGIRLGGPAAMVAADRPGSQEAAVSFKRSLITLRRKLMTTNTQNLINVLSRSMKSIGSANVSCAVGLCLLLGASAAGDVFLHLDNPDSDAFLEMTFAGVNPGDNILDPGASIGIGDWEYFDGSTSVFNDAVMSSESSYNSFPAFFNLRFAGPDAALNRFAWTPGPASFNASSTWSDLLGTVVDGHGAFLYLSGVGYPINMNENQPNIGDSAWQVTQLVPEPTSLSLLCLGGLALLRRRAA